MYSAPRKETFNLYTPALAAVVSGNLMPRVSHAGTLQRFFTVMQQHDIIKIFSNVNKIKKPSANCKRPLIAEANIYALCYPNCPQGVLKIKWGLSCFCQRLAIQFFVLQD